MKLSILYSFLFLTLLACQGNDKKKNKTDPNPDENTTGEEPIPEPGNLEVGGIPPISELKAAQDLSLDGANKSTKKVQAVTGSLAIELDNSGEAVSLSGGECTGGAFCMAKGFSDIYNMVTSAAQCNFDLIMHDKAKLKKIKDYPVYYAQGFGTIGFGDSGTQACPKVSRVIAWAKSEGLMALGKGESKSDFKAEKDEFYVPTRLVVYKKKDGNLHWRFVFFPKDMMQYMVKRVPYFERFLEEHLDFIGFTGYHDLKEDVGEGIGQVILNFEEVGRMMKMFEDDDKEESDGTFPTGKIKIDYDMKSELKHYTTVFQDGFSFGDGGDDPFTTETETIIMKKGNENYLHFQSGQPFISPDDDGPTSTVRRCNNQDLKISEVPKEDYLKAVSQTHMQLIWTDVESGDSQPDNWLASIISTQGGAFIYGSTDVQLAQKGGSELHALRLKVPKCDESVDVHMDYDGYINMVADEPFGENMSSGPRFVSSAEVTADFPLFSTFRLRDVEDGKDSPLVSEYSKSGQESTPPIYSGACEISDTSGFSYCWQHNDMIHMEYVYAGYQLCQDQNFGSTATATWTLDKTCPTTNVVGYCNDITNYSTHAEFDYSNDITYYSPLDSATIQAFFCKETAMNGTFSEP